MQKYKIKIPLLKVKIMQKSNEKVMNRNWSNQKANPALETKMGNNQNHK